MSQSFPYLYFLGTGVKKFDGPQAEAWYKRYRQELHHRGLQSSLFVWPDIAIDVSHRFFWGLAQAQISSLDIRHVFITHSHQDHFQPSRIGALALLRAENLCEKTQVYGSPTTIDLLLNDERPEGYGTAYFDGNLQQEAVEHLEVHPLSPGDTVTLGDRTVTAIPSSHHTVARSTGEQPLYYLFEWADNTTMAYLVDSSLLWEEALNLLDGYHLDILIHECTYLLREDISPVNSGHCSWVMVVENLNTLRHRNIIDGQTRMFTTHMHLPAGPDYPELVEVFSSEGVTAGYDGLIVPVMI
jgi:phosphoribosyl 1,2-cyclic phosphate phosphodiesterase